MRRIERWIVTQSIWITPGLFAVKYFIPNANAQQPTLVTNTGMLPANLWCPIIAELFDILIFLSVIMALWAAYNYITAGDDTDKTTKARKYLTYAAVGIVVALIANGFPALVTSLFPSASGGGTNLQACP